MAEAIRPLEIDGLEDYHCHCDYSIDAINTIDEYCQAAIARNLKTLCFTTHYDPNPNSLIKAYYIRIKGVDSRVSPDALAPYVEDVQRAKEKYARQGLTVKLGVEYGWYHGAEEAAIRLFEKYPFDYKLCGVHEIDDICFCSQSSYERCFDGKTAEYIAEDYFRQATNAANTKLFTTIAHLGYYLRKGILFYGDSMLTTHRPFMGDFLTAMKASGTALEINTGGVRHGHPFFYPTPEMIMMADQAGVPVKYLGSDSHRPEHVGFQFDKAMQGLTHDARKTTDSPV